MSSTGYGPGSAQPQQPVPPPPKKKSKMLVGCLIAAGLFFCILLPITGIVAAIAIPNFIKYQCKSKQIEAKMNLKSLEISEEAFKADHGYYTSDLAALSWQPDGSPRYLYGFADAGPGNVRKSEAPEDYDETRQDTGSLASKRFATTNMVQRGGMPLSSTDLPDSYVERDHFVAAAVGDPAGSGNLDTWTVDEKGDLRNDMNGCSPGMSSMDDRD